MNRFHIASRRRAWLSTGSALIALACAAPAFAQDAAAPAGPPAQDAAPKEIVVTGSRIVSSGFSAPESTRSCTKL